MDRPNDGIALFVLVQVGLVLLKLTGTLDQAWWLILLPLEAAALLLAFLVAFVVLAVLWAAWDTRGRL